MLVYALLRVGLFLAVLAVLYLLGGRGGDATSLILLVAVAALVSLPLSLLVLRRQRDAMSHEVDARFSRRAARRAGGRTDADAAAEDAEAEDERRRGEGG